MTIHGRLEKIRDTYINNANACKESGFDSSYKILMADADILTDYIESMPIGIAGMHAWENE